MGRSRSRESEPEVVPCPGCGEDTTVDDIGLCQDCQGLFCGGCGDFGYMCCQDCLEESDEEAAGEELY